MIQATSSLLHIHDYKTRGYDTMMAHVLHISTIWILGPALQSLAQNWTINKYKYTNENDLLYFTDSKTVFLFHFYHFWNQNASYNWCCIKDKLAVCFPCCFFAPFLIRYIPMVYLTIKGGVCVCVSFSCSVVSNSFATPWTVARQAPLSMEFPWQQYWSGLPFPSPEDLLNPGIKLLFPALAGGFFTTESQEKP